MRSLSSRCEVGQCLDQCPDILMKMRSGLVRVQAEEIFPLAHPDDHGDPRSEARDDRVRYEADHATELGEAHREKHEPRHQRRHLEAGDAVLRSDSREHDDECAGRARNLYPCPAQQRSRESRNDCRVDSLLRLGTGCDCKRHRERQGDHADDAARDDVPPDFAPPEKAGAPCLEEGDHWWRPL